MVLSCFRGGPECSRSTKFVLLVCSVSHSVSTMQMLGTDHVTWELLVLPYMSELQFEWPSRRAKSDS